MQARIFCGNGKAKNPSSFNPKKQETTLPELPPVHIRNKNHKQVAFQTIAFCFLPIFWDSKKEKNESQSFQPVERK